LAGEETGEASLTDEYHKQPTPGVTTVVVPPATRNQELSVAHQNKLIRDKEYQRRKRANEKARAATVSDVDEDVVSTSRRPNKRARGTDD
jgi:chromatin modification-related protein EAF6